MRQRLSRSDRRAAILAHARPLFMAKGLAGTEMEDIRRACGISRGGLYHHFAHKRAVLFALVEEEICALAEDLTGSTASPIPALLRAGSSHLGRAPGLHLACVTADEKRDYLSALDDAFSTVLKAPLAARLTGHVHPGTNPMHVAELFLTVTAHINRREILGEWSEAEAAGFAATALAALAPLLRSPDDLHPIIAELERAAQC